MDVWSALLGSGYMEHGHCYRWEPPLVLLHGLSDGFIALAYFTIPLTLYWIVRRRSATPFRGMVLAFTAFILACGLGHALEVVTLFEPVYWVSGASKGVTAAVSVLTAGLLAVYAPGLTRVPTPEALEASLRREQASAERLKRVIEGSVDAFFLLEGAECQVRFDNAVARTLVGGPSGGQPIAAVLPETERATLLDLLREATDTGVTVSREIALALPDGPRIFQAQAIPLPDGVGLFLRDLTEERAAREAERLLAAVVDNSEDGIFTTDADGVVLSWNRGAEALLGRSAEDTVGGSIQAFCPPERHEEQRAALEGALAGVSSTPLETVRLHADGHSVPVSINLSPLPDPDGRVRRVSAILRDLTSSRQAEALREALSEREVLVREVHHRVKNDLQIATSMMRLGLRAIEDPSARRVVEDGLGRLQAIALVHEQLYREGRFGRIALDVFLGRLAAGMGRVADARIRIETHLEPVEAGLHQAIPAGLILHELLANAIQHGFPGEAAGSVTVHLTADADEVVIEVRDDGVPFPDAADTGLGQRLITALTEQLGGTLSRDEAPMKRTVVRFPRPAPPARTGKSG
jgi:PAS domain S-box-containing protein